MVKHKKKKRIKSQKLEQCIAVFHTERNNRDWAKALSHSGFTLFLNCIVNTCLSSFLCAYVEQQNPS